MPVKEMSYRQLNYAETATFGRGLVSIVNKKGPQEETNLMVLKDRLDGNLTELEASSGGKPLDTMDSLLKKADERRDVTYTKILHHVKGLIKNLDEKTAQAASVIYDSLVRHDTNLVNMSYESETHHLKALTIELKKPEFTDHLNTLKITDNILQLEKENNEFDDLYNKRNSEKAPSSEEIKLVDLVKAVRTNILQIIGYVDIVDTIKPDLLKPVVDEISAAVSELAPKVEARKTRAENSSEKKNPPVDQPAN